LLTTGTFPFPFLPSSLSANLPSNLCSFVTKKSNNTSRQSFRGHLKDDWALPSAHYEMAALDWNEKDLEGVDSKAKVLDCEQWLVKTQKWGESYVLDTRMSFKITTSLITVKRHKGIMGY
jgi:hypothetical protein